MISDRKRIDPFEFESNVALLTRKIEESAARAGIPEDECTDLECTLAALPPVVRDRVKVLLQGIEMQSQETNGSMALSARYVLNLAREVWGDSPTAATAAAAASLKIQAARRGR